MFLIQIENEKPKHFITLHRENARAARDQMKLLHYSFTWGEINQIWSY